jgi:hypothetical protein
VSCAIARSKRVAFDKIAKVFANLNQRSRDRPDIRIKAAKQMGFTKPKDGDIVVVNYPFLFKSAK